MITFYLNKKEIVWASKSFLEGQATFQTKSHRISAFEADTLLDTLKPIVTREMWRGAPVSIAVSHNQLIYKSITLESLQPDWATYQQVRSHFKAYFNQDVSDFSVDFEIIDAVQRKIRVVALPIDCVAMISAVFSTLGLQVKAIDVAPFVLESILPKNEIAQFCIYFDQTQIYLMKLSQGWIVAFEWFEKTEALDLPIKIDIFLKKQQLQTNQVLLIGESIDLEKFLIRKLENVEPYPINQSLRCRHAG